MKADDSHASVSAGGNRSDAPAPAHITISLENIKDYEFRVKFDKEQYEELEMDEPPPLGTDKAPNASRILAAAVGNCLCASLLFCARKSRAALRGVHAEVTLHYTRNQQGRVRIGKIEVRIQPSFEETDSTKAARCLEIFEDYCVVTQSVRSGITVSVSIVR